MLSTPDKVWLRTEFPQLTEDASAIVTHCKQHATNPFTEPETLFGRSNARAKFWAELGRQLDIRFAEKWRNGTFDLIRDAAATQRISDHLMEEYHRVRAISEHVERTRP